MTLPDLTDYGYRALKPIGEGGSGVVYLAQRLTDEQEVAVKHLNPGAGTAPGMQEFALLATLQHPHVVTCLDFIYGDAASCFIVYEYMAGGSLRDQFQQQGKLSSAEACSMVRQVAAGLAYLHGKGLVHGDIKPENILRQRDATCSYKIADLGSAFTVLKSKAARSQGLRMPCGSPAYMAPEMFHREPVMVSDLYGLGILLYEAIVGNRPFIGGPRELAQAHLHEEIAFDLVADGTLRRLLIQLLEKDPERRIQPVEAVIQALETGSVPASRNVLPLAQNAVPAPSAPSARQSHPCVFEKVASFPIPEDVQEIHPIWLPDHPALVFDFGTHLELYDGLTGHTYHRYCPKSSLPAQTMAPDSLAYAHRKGISEWWPARDETRELRGDLAHLTAFAMAEDGQRLIWCQPHRMVYERLSDHQTTLSREWTYYQVGLGFGFLDNGYFCVPSALNAELTIFDHAGEVQHRFPLEGLLLHYSQQSGPLFFVTLISDSRWRYGLYAYVDGQLHHRVLEKHQVRSFNFVKPWLMVVLATGDVLRFDARLKPEYLPCLSPSTRLLHFSPEGTYLYETSQIAGQTRTLNTYMNHGNCI